MKRPAKPKQQKVEDDVAREVDLHLKHERLKAAEAYALRGRRFKDLSLPVLREKYAAALLVWASGPTFSNPGPDRQIKDDCHSEYALRGLDAPRDGDDIERAMALLRPKMLAAQKHVNTEPGLAEEIGREISEEMGVELLEIKGKNKN